METDQDGSDPESIKYIYQLAYHRQDAMIQVAYGSEQPYLALWACVVMQMQTVGMCVAY